MVDDHVDAGVVLLCVEVFVFGDRIRILLKVEVIEGAPAPAPSLALALALMGKGGRVLGSFWVSGHNPAKALGKAVERPLMKPSRLLG